MWLSLFSNDEKGTVLLAKFASGPVMIGRNAERCQVVIDSAVVSTIHGEFVEFEGRWLFKDLASSNGSFLNGQKLQSDYSFVLRSGDKLSIAHHELEVQIEQPTLSAAKSPALIVTRQWEPFLLREIREPGIVLEVGGSSNDLPFLKAELADSAVRFEWDGAVLTVDTPVRVSSYPLKLNNEPITGLYQLQDRDLLEFHEYTFLIDFPAPDSSAETAAPAGVKTWLDPEDGPMNVYEAKAHRAKGRRFGHDSAIEEADQTDSGIAIFEKPVRAVPALMAAKQGIDQEKMMTWLLIGAIIMTLVVTAIYFTM